VTGSLRELAEESLMVEDEAGERYAMHDLIRRYAQSLAERDDPAESETAVGRLLAYYCDAAAQADALLTRQPAPEAIVRPAPTVREDFADLFSVIRWCHVEFPNLLACADYVVRQAENGGRREENIWVVMFASALAGILRNEGWWRRSIELQTQAYRAAEVIGLPVGAANALSERGMLYRLTAELGSAAADLDRAIAIYQQIGGVAGRAGEARSLNTYGVVLDQLGQPDEAKRRLSEALGIYRQIGDSLGEANVLHDQGMAELFSRDYDSAIALLGQALDLYQTVGQPLGMAHAHTSLGRALQHVGAEADAAGNLDSARVLYRDLGNRLGEINVLARLGTVLRRNDPDRAAEVLTEAIRLSSDIGNQLARIEALDELGEVYLMSGNKKAAMDAWSRALRLAMEHGIEREATKLAGKVGRGR
jgi:tetratricopeptide (TPR) repeat protein